LSFSVTKGTHNGPKRELQKVTNEGTKITNDGDVRFATGASLAEMLAIFALGEVIASQRTDVTKGKRGTAWGRRSVGKDATT